ncbi:MULTISPECIES: MetS family NSS transporter small subunit [unclassified Leucobacter]|uniref:MetS family NSS transporter small subunit n=1 Tax=unclassified Leucobacter TaxID=2621730 RepID=UPI00165DE2A5|nr:MULTISPECIES: MetS family NSS transporter small subunit [unclassified Leucobacter]MBC9926090.1 MetS family NSS transporter small subunit [Leucobacter sp. cx-169]MBC9935746.1 MetS family NSS transporter small subunit [Leucobacter sp. cx-87]
MTPIALSFLGLAAVLVWGGLIVSTIMLARRGEIDQYPDGGEDGADEELDD